LDDKQEHTTAGLRTRRGNGLYARSSATSIAAPRAL
jgi:hypothetical protein